MKFCPQCGTAFESEARFCLECGFDRSVVEPVGPEVTMTPGINDSRTNTLPETPVENLKSLHEDKPGCLQCGGFLDKNDRFCPACGFDASTVEPAADIIPQPMQPHGEEERIVASRPIEEEVSYPENNQICPKCSFGIEPGEGFCQECGFDTSAGKISFPEVSQPAQQPIAEEASTTSKPVEEPVSATETEIYCPQCASGIAPGDRFCQECGFDTSVDKPSDAAKPEPVIIPPVAPPLVNKPAFIPPPPEPARSPAAAYTQTERSGKPATQPKRKKTIFWSVLVVAVLGALGAAGWFGYKWYLESPQKTSADSVITMGIPENAEIETDAINDEAAEQSEAVAAKQPEAKTKPLSRIDQELAKQKAKAKNQPAQQTGDDQPSIEILSIETDNDIVPKVLLEVGKKEDPKYKNPKNPTKLKLQKPTMIVRITTDHYNGGMGTPRGGTITIKDKNGNIVGSYKAQGKTGKNGTPSAKWVATPNIMLEEGTYFIADSDISTWSKTFLGNDGFILIEGYVIE